MPWISKMLFWINLVIIKRETKWAAVLMLWKPETLSQTFFFFPWGEFFSEDLGQVGVPWEPAYRVTVHLGWVPGGLFGRVMRKTLCFCDARLGRFFFWENELSSQNESRNACVSKPEAPCVLLAPLPGLFAWASRAPGKRPQENNMSQRLAWVLAPRFWQSAWEHLFWVICSPKTPR